ncbi:SRPBCC family protein [uncultured Nitratireductor sp.]|uniref:SRPBCC family protein n=1 Tax=uncultured Nitratireductor sp. TaxID=520953 RepID=UPI0025E2D1F6|nr:SRPBCC family protein [uncultured Nitratireductor sp.]
MTSSEVRDQGKIVTATADHEAGEVDASAFFRCTPERLFRALVSDEICKWWVRPGVFDTREWSGEVWEGGAWKATGVGGGQPYRLEGEFVVIDAPRKLTQTWKPAGAPIAPALLSYTLEPSNDGVQLRLRHTNLTNPDICEKTRAGWETSLSRLQEIISPEPGGSSNGL